MPVDTAERATADSVEVTFVGAKTDQYRNGCTITRGRNKEGEDGIAPVGAFEAIVALLDVTGECTFDD